MATAASPVLVVVGWWWVNKTHNERERRKELRQLVDRAQETVTATFETALRYHSGSSERPAGDSRDGWRLLLAVNQVRSQLLLLACNGIPATPCVAVFNRLKQAVTGHDFMTNAYKPWSDDDRRWMDLLEATESLTHHLDKTFFDLFKHRSATSADGIRRRAE
jgi:hypothetical protein